MGANGPTYAAGTIPNNNNTSNNNITNANASATDTSQVIMNQTALSNNAANGPSYVPGQMGAQGPTY